MPRSITNCVKAPLPAPARRAPPPNTEHLMRVILFYHSLLSCWNNGHAHFLRGYASELMARGHDVTVYEPENGWSYANLLADAGEAGLVPFREQYPHLRSAFYSPRDLDLDRMLDSADLVIAHEWNEPALIRALGQHRRTARYRLLFHDSHHRAATCPAAIDLQGFDGALVYGDVLRDMYLQRKWASAAWTWHEAADTRIFHPLPALAPELDLVWIGNWGDEERTAELHEFLIEPVRTLGLKAAVYGVRFPQSALQSLRSAAIEYRGWLANPRVPEIFARSRLTIHVPRRPYVHSLPGIPTIRLFEALACGIPLVSAPWNDSEGLFSAGRDYLPAATGADMTSRLRFLLDHRQQAATLGRCGAETVRARHTCAHRVDELLEICRELGLGDAASAPHRTIRLQEMTT
jgi:spore maturation protein CgeB